jgi:DNA repair exonuclease SbcCD ATPase subunit
MENERAKSFEDRNMMTSPTNIATIAQETRLPMSPVSDEPYHNPMDYQNPMDIARQKPETYQPSQDQSISRSRSSSRVHPSALGNVDRNQVSAMSNIDRFDETPRQSIDQASMTDPKVTALQQQDAQAPQDSGVGSSPALTHQYDQLQKELDKVKQKNAWYASELAIARKSGYQTRSSDTPVMDERSADVFSEDDKPLIEALLKMRAELARVQETIDAQSKEASSRIADMEKQRDAAISEAVFAKARLAGHGSPNPDKEGQRGTPDHERSNDLSKRLAVSIASHNTLSSKHEGLSRELELERQARQLAEETADAAQKRVTELDMRHQQLSSEIEELRSELHESQTQHRDISANHAEMLTQHRMLTVDKDELHGKYQNALSETQNHSAILLSLQAAVAASTEKAQSLESKLDAERAARSDVEEKLRQLRVEHETRASELDNASRRLQDAEEIAEKHAREADTHRAVVMAGLGKVTDRGNPQVVSDERVAILQSQLESANDLVRQNQAAADSASEKLRRAEERIAGLEAYQEQASRESLTIRKQLQTHLRDVQNMTNEKVELEQKLQSQLLETNALAVQHGALKDILQERGINAADVRRSRALDSPSSLSRFSTPDLHRVKELEQQLDASLKSHDEMKTQFEDVSERDEKMKREYEEKLTALDNDHQAAVKYLRGTEKMLSKMKQELQRVKNENGDLRKKVEKIRGDGEGSARGTPEVPADWEVERDNLKKEVEATQVSLKSSVAGLEEKLATMQSQLQTAESELEQTRTSHATARSDLTTLQATHLQTCSDIERMQKENSMLEERARDAENKVQLLLDQVEHSVDNYRRQSRMSDMATPVPNGTASHSRTTSTASEATTIDQDTLTGLQHHNHIGGGHTRSTSDGALSMISTTTSNADGRNSLALDSLASELETLRSHWETTNKNYRLSEKFDFEHQQQRGTAPARTVESLASWRKGLDIDEDDENSRPSTAHGPGPMMTQSNVQKF